jgi:hypothetical protein
MGIVDDVAVNCVGPDARRSGGSPPFWLGVRPNGQVRQSQSLHRWRAQLRGVCQRAIKRLHTVI